MDVVEIWKEKAGQIEGLTERVEGMQKIGMCGTPQPEFLFSLASSLPGRGAIVEIGTCSGISLVAMGLAQKLKGGAKVTSIDIATHQDLEDNLSFAQVEEYVDCVVRNSNELALEWKDPIELLWIDGDHSYQGAARDIRAWEGFVLEGGLIALHDYRDDIGVFKAIQENILARPWVWRVVSDREYGSIFVAEKIAPSDVKPWIDQMAAGNRWKERIQGKLRALGGGRS